MFLEEEVGLGRLLKSLPLTILAGCQKFAEQQQCEMGNSDFFFKQFTSHLNTNRF